MTFFWLIRVSLRVQGSAYRPVFTKSLRSQEVSLVTGRLTNSPTLHLYTGPFHRVIWPVRKENDLQSRRSGNRTRVTQLELTLFRAPYPLDQRSFPFFWTFPANYKQNNILNRFFFLHIYCRKFKNSKYPYFGVLMKNLIITNLPQKCINNINWLYNLSYL